MSIDVPIEDTFSKTVFADNIKLKLTVDYYVELAKHDIKEKIDQRQIQIFSIELKNQYHSEMPVVEINKKLTEIFEYIATGNSTKGMLELMGMTLKDCLLSYKHNQFVSKDETTEKSNKSKNTNGNGIIRFLVAFAVLLCVVLTVTIISVQKIDDNSITELSTTNQTTLNTLTQKSESLPETGEIIINSEMLRESQITIKNSSSNCYVKLKDQNHNDVFGFFVRSNDTVTVDVPCGNYYVYFAYGDKWYGKSELFGDETYCSRDEDLQDFNNYSITYTLYNVDYGNFNPEHISVDEF